MTTLVNLLHRFEQFVTAHQQITTFSHGQITDLDTFKETDFPVMHVVWNGATPSLENNGSGVMNWDFQVLFLDKPNTNEDKTNQAKYVQSDCAQYALDLLATIRFGDIFDEDVEVASAGLQAITESFTNVLWGAALNLGLLTDYDVNYCDAPLDEISGGFTPCTLCGLIAGANAVQIVDCLSDAQEAAISALICPSTDPSTFTLNGTVVGTAEGGETLNVQVLQGGVVVGSLVGADWVIPPCPTPEPATYTNGAAFTQEIAAGQTFTAPQVTMTAVDGTTEDIPANEDYVCEWKPIIGVDSEGIFVNPIAIESYPAGGEYLLPDRKITDLVGSSFTIPFRLNTRITNANIAAAVNDTPIADAHNLTIEVNVPVNNSAGDSVGGNVDDLLNPHVLPDLPLTDSDGAVGSYPMPTALAVVGQVNSATYSGGTLTITPAGGGGTVSLIPKRPHVTQVTSYGYGTEGWAIAQGYFNYPDEGRLQDIDLTAAIPFVTLRHAVSGSTARFRDSAGNALQYEANIPADSLVLDYLNDLMFYSVPFTNGVGYADILTKVEALNAANHAGYNDWFLTPIAVIDMLFDFNRAFAPQTLQGRPPGFAFSWLAGIASGTTIAEFSTAVYIGIQNGNEKIQVGRLKTATNLNNYMICRRMNAY